MSHFYQRPPSPYNVPTNYASLRPYNGYCQGNSTSFGGPFALDESDLERLDAEISRPLPYIAPPASADVEQENIDPRYLGLGNSESPLAPRRGTAEAAWKKAMTPPTSSSPHVDQFKHQQQQQRSHQNYPLFQQSSNQHHLQSGRQPLANIENIQPQNGNGARPLSNKSFMDVLKAERDRALEEMQALCEQRIELTRKTEMERAGAMENEYKRQLAKMQQDMDLLLRKQEDVFRLKNTVDQDLQRELERIKQEWKKERELRRTEKERLEQRIRELQDKIDQLQRKFGRAHHSISDTANKTGSSSRQWTAQEKQALVRDYEGRISQLQQENDQKIADLIRQFEKEKQSALQILKARIKSEINLLVPRIRQQCQNAFNQALLRLQEQTTQKLKEKYSAMTRRLKEEHTAEKRFIQKQAREDCEIEKTDFQKRLRTRYEMKALQIKNECERRLLERLRGTSNPSHCDDQPSFLSDLQVISDPTSELDSFVV